MQKETAIHSPYHDFGANCRALRQAEYSLRVLYYATPDLLSPRIADYISLRTLESKRRRVRILTEIVEEGSRIDEPEERISVFSSG